MNILPQIADSMQVVLNETADAIARKTGLIKRQRKIKDYVCVDSRFYIPPSMDPGYNTFLELNG